jgi:hypothetical protein
MSEEVDELIEAALAEFPELADCQDPEEQVKILAKFIALQEEKDRFSASRSRLLLRNTKASTMTGGGGGDSSPSPSDGPAITLNDAGKYNNLLDFAIRKGISLSMHLQTSLWNESVEAEYDYSDVSCEFKAEGKKVVVQGYSAKEFRVVRCLFKISEADIVKSVCLSGKLIGGTSPGKSGSVMFISPDQKYVLKGISAGELRVLQEEFLKEYARHLSQFPNSLLPRFYGAFRITTPSETYRFVIMNNVFSPDSRIDVIYDLKGSRLGRAATRDSKKSNRVVVQKDLDFEENNRTLLMERTTQLCFELQMETDVAFLQRLNVMDYSLLVGISFISPSPESPPIQITEDESIFRREQGGFRARMPDGTLLLEIYYLGIIDVLQQFNFTKAVESSMKSIAYDKNEISSVNSEMYAQRFINFIKRGIGPPSSSI